MILTLDDFSTLCSKMECYLPTLISSPSSSLKKFHCKELGAFGCCKSGCGGEGKSLKGVDAHSQKPSGWAHPTYSNVGIKARVSVKEGGSKGHDLPILPCHQCGSTSTGRITERLFWTSAECSFQPHTSVHLSLSTSIRLMKILYLCKIINSMITQLQPDPTPLPPKTIP